MFSSVEIGRTKFTQQGFYIQNEYESLKYRVGRGTSHRQKSVCLDQSPTSGINLKSEHK